ncbi:MAG: outer membrane beta-barrel protein [Proteobacteria bacterium]|nr:outer membrane beta-barrel protein [Pseudomonadota bacterium]
MKLLFRTAAAVLFVGAAVTPALAEGYSLFSGPTGYQAGDVMTHLSIIGVIPQNINSHITGVPGARLGISTGVSPEVDASYFVTPNLSVQLIAATSRHTITAKGGALGNGGTLGSTWVLPPTLTAQWHFPQIGVVRPYVGVGVTVAFFYGTSPSAQLLGTSDKLGLRTAIGPSFDVGFDVPVQDNWSVNMDVKQMILPTAARLDHGAIHAMTGLDPTVIGFGVGYQF